MAKPSSLSTMCDAEEVNWLKTGRGLLHLRNVLIPETVRVMKEFHENITTNICAAECSCTAENLKKDTKNPPCTTCRKLRKKINGAGTDQKTQLIWSNTDPSRWLENFWEVAKCFLGSGQKNNRGPKDTDPANLLTLWINCGQFAPLVDTPTVLIEARNTRNKLMHDPEMKCSAENLQTYFNNMLNVVKDSKLCAHIIGQSAVADLERIRDEPLNLVPSEVANLLKDLGRSLKAELADTYLQHYSNLQPVPWSNEVSLPINLVYQEQTVMERKGASRQNQGSSELKSILELWGEEPSRPGKILVESPAGTGKSTLCQQLIQAWAMRVNASASASQSATTEAAYQHQEASQEDFNNSRLHQYHLVFFIKVRDLIDGDLTQNLQENVVNNSWKHEDLKECISKNIEKVLLIVDGYDEGNDAQKCCVDRWLKGTDCRGCTLIVTSRPGFCRPTEDRQNPNRTYTLMGLDRAQQQDFALKFDQVMGVGPGKISASEQLQQFQDRDFLQTPLLLALVCVLASQGQGALPKTVSGLYNEFTEFLSLKAMRGPINFSNDYVAELLKFLQEIAFKLFTLKKSEITTDELITHVAKSEVEKTIDNLCKLGLVQQEITLKGWKNSQTGEFIHQSFLDYFAACYFVSVSKEERSTLLEGMDLQENMLLLAAGVCGESGDQHRECFGQMLEAWDRAVQRGWYDHSVLHACFLWLTELRDPCWLHADHISAIYRTSDKESDGEGICLSSPSHCTASCWRGVTALLDAAHHHTLHDPRHAPCDPATFKLLVYSSDADISPAAQLDLLDAARRYNVQLDCEGLHFPVCLTRAQYDQLRAVFTRLNQLKYLYITVPSWTAANIVLQGLNSTSPLWRLSVTCSPSSPRDSPPAAPVADAAEDSWSPRELIDTISRFSELEEIGLNDAESTLSTEHRRYITRRLRDRRPPVEVEIYDRDSQTGEVTRWEMDSESDVDSDTSQLHDSGSDA